VDVHGDDSGSLSELTDRHGSGPDVLSALVRWELAHDLVEVTIVHAH
jgi:hypothetical protein